MNAQRRYSRYDCIRLDGVGDVPAKFAAELEPGDVCRFARSGSRERDGFVVLAKSWVGAGLIEVTYREFSTLTTHKRRHRRVERIGVYPDADE